MPSAPRWFINELKVFDPALRVRWSPICKMFQLERKIAHGMPINTTKSDFTDDFIRARDGYILVAMIEPGKFSRSIFSTLRGCDLWSNGGWEAMADLIEEIEAREEAEKWRAFENDVHAMSQDLYHWLKIRDGRSIYGPGIPS
jgi:hypothetical protein